MDNTNNILTGLSVISQVPLDSKRHILNEAALIDLGLNNNLAYIYYDGLIVYCAEEGTRYQWKEISVGVGPGLLNDDFVYPPGIIVNGIDYSNKSYNFFSADNDSAFQRNLMGAFVRGRNETYYGDVGFGANDLGISDSPSTTKGALADYSTIGGGLNNSITLLGIQAVISGGFRNTNGGKSSGIGSGSDCIINDGAWYSFIGGGVGNTIFSTGVTQGAFIGTGNGNTILGENSGIVTGFFNNIILEAKRSLIGAGQSNEINQNNCFIGSGFTNKAGAFGSFIGSGANNETKGNLGSILGAGNISDSYGEVALGLYGTTYIPASRVAVNIADRILNVGIGLNNATRIDAFSIFKNGVGTLPTVTNALITAASGKAIVTKEYLSAQIAAIPPADGSETKITSGTGISVTGVGTIGSPYIINNTHDGSETKIANGTNTTVSGSGTIGSPYQITVPTPDGSETKLVNGTNTTVTGSGTIGSPYQVNVSFAATPQVIVLNLNTWVKDQQHSILTGLTTSTILDVQVKLQCIVDYGSFVVGDIVSVGAPEVNDSGGHPDQGIGVEFNNINPTVVRILVGVGIYIMNPWSADGSNNGVHTVGSESNWSVRLIVTYI